ncbi:MAG: SUMF1/EgtB/PvdO family nonheme iron enzyme [Elusimicrobia bacterium]|nr:SUMF1/EgtB/PvdO family nonheme iron enzyme [Elusimicrobiota bacterium]
MKNCLKNNFAWFSLFYILTGFLIASEKTVKPTIAVAEFEGQGLSASELLGISEFVRTGLINTELFNMVDRRNMEQILQEQKFQISGCTTEECAVKMGQLLNVQKIVTGKVIKLGGKFYITANIIDVETGRIAISERLDATGIDQLADKSESLAAILANRLLGKRPTPKMGSVAPFPVTEEIAKGSAFIQSDPPDAEIFIDGEKLGRTPMKVEVSIGQRQLVLMKEGYIDKSAQLNIIADTTVKISETLTPMLGSVLIKSNPAGARVWFDGNYRGMTDSAGLKISGITLGEYTVKFEKEKFYPLEQKVIVKYKDVVEIFPKLLEKPGSVFITSTPKGAKIYIDETYKGETPLKVTEVSAGLHSLKLSMSEYKNWDKQIEIRGLETTTVTADLEPAPAGYISGIIGGKEITGRDGAEMVLIPAGEFTMGSDGGDSDEKPAHKVYLDAYYIDKYEVTFEQYDKFCEATGRTKPSDSGWGRGNRPVINVSWHDAVAYANYYGKRLPTEAEWEKACRGGSETEYCFGDSESKLSSYAWYYANSGGKTHPVGQKKPNQYGIYDMHGNVWEWCSDWYDSGYYKNSPYKNPKGSGSDSRVLRGGCWNYFASDCRSSNRGRRAPGGGSDFRGFRCAVGVVQGR